MKKFALILCSTTILAGCSTTQLSSNSSDRSLGNALSSYRTLSNYEAGKKQLRAGNFGLAIEAFKLALDQDPKSIEALNGIAIAYTRLGRDDAAQAYWDRALEADPQSKITNMNLAYLHLTRGEATAAEEFAQRAKNPASLKSSSIEVVGSAPTKSVEVHDVMGTVQPKYAAEKQFGVTKVGTSEWQLNTMGVAQAQPTAPTIIKSVMLAPSTPVQQSAAPAPVKTASSDMQPVVPAPVETAAMASTNGLRRVFITENNTIMYVPLNVPSPEALAPAKAAEAASKPTPVKTAAAEVQSAAPVKTAGAEASASSETAVPVPIRTASVEPMNKADAFVRVSNGAGITTMAGRFSGYLSQHGVSTNLIANASSFNYRQTVIFYNPGTLNAAQQIASVMPVSVKLVEVKGGSGVVEVVLGSDLAEFDNHIRSA